MFNLREFYDFKEELHELTGQRNLIRNQLRRADARKDELDQEYEDSLFLRALIQEIARQTMDNLSYRISSIVTAALKAIPFPDAPEFEAEFVNVRNQVECNLWFVTDGNRSKPIESSGGGALDVASLALRLTYWSLRKNRPTFILDEPFKYVSVDLQEKCAEMIKMLSERMGVQIIMVSHLPNINITADKEYRVEMKDGKSVVREVK